MSRINTNVDSLIAQNSLLKNQNSLSQSLLRLSTGLRINSGADDPSGLIASQQLQSNQASINAALNNAQSADQLVGTAEGGLSEVNSLLTQIQGLVTSTSNTSSHSRPTRRTRTSSRSKLDHSSRSTVFPRRPAFRAPPAQRQL